MLLIKDAELLESNMTNGAMSSLQAIKSQKLLNMPMSRNQHNASHMISRKKMLQSLEKRNNEMGKLQLPEINPFNNQQ
jgi:hypothetical protein